VLERWMRVGNPGVKVVNEPVYAAGSGTNGALLIATNAVYLPEEVLNYRSEVIPVLPIVWESLPKDTVYGQRWYRAPDGFGIQNLVVLMGRDRTSIHQPQYCLKGGGWDIVRETREDIEIPGADGYSLPVMRLTLSKSVHLTNGVVSRGGTFVYWFVADNELTAEHATRMRWMTQDLLFKGVLQRWAYVICFAECPPGREDEAYRRIREFIVASVPRYQSPPRSNPGRNSKTPLQQAARE
jgi:hypothetical protein